MRRACINWFHYKSKFLKAKHDSCSDIFNISGKKIEKIIFRSSKWSEFSAVKYISGTSRIYSHKQFGNIVESNRAFSIKEWSHKKHFRGASKYLIGIQISGFSSIKEWNQFYEFFAQALMINFENYLLAKFNTILDFDIHLI